MPTLERVHFEPTAPLYEQLYEHLRAAILSGRLKKGVKLPSTRALAEEWGISRNTVLNAYDQLLAEGYLESRQGSGTYVVTVLPEVLLSKPLGGRVQAPAAPAPPQLSKVGKAVLTATKLIDAPARKSGGLRFAFHAAMPALDMFPFELWSKIVAKQSQRLSPDLLTYREVAGYRPLREAIAHYVTVARHVRCTPDQVIIVSGSQSGLDLAARVLLNPGDAIWMEDPGYLGARYALQNAGADLIPVPIDAEGLNVEAGMAVAPQARLAYVTPSHQFPLGVMMSLNRRLALLNWADRAQAYILEDDYNSEYRYSGRPLASLQGLDEKGRVIYIGTMSKVLFPSLRLGYLIVPPPLVDVFVALRSYVDFHPPILDQLVLTEFITAGHFARHVRRMRALYAERRLALLEALAGLSLEVESPAAGMHLLAWLPQGVDDRGVVKRAAAQHLAVMPLSAFRLCLVERGAIMLGFAALDHAEIQEGVRRLKMALG